MFHMNIEIDVLSDAPSSDDIKEYIRKCKIKKIIGYTVFLVALCALVLFAVYILDPTSNHLTQIITTIATLAFMLFGLSAKDQANLEITAFKEVRPDTEPDHYIALAAEAEHPDIKAYLDKVHQQNRCLTYKEYHALLAHSRKDKLKEKIIKAEKILANNFSSD